MIEQIIICPLHLKAGNKVKEKVRVCVRCGNAYLSNAVRSHVCENCKIPTGGKRRKVRGIDLRRK